MRIFVIAEAGVNHNGNARRAHQLVDIAAAAGADAVKFQTFRAEGIATAAAAKTAYQKKTTGANESQLAMLRRLELSQPLHRELIDRCRRKRIKFLSTPFDFESLRFLVDELRMTVIKIGSGEITNGPFLLAAARTGRKIILSTGMSTLREVRDALSVLAFGFIGSGRPSQSALANAFASASGQRAIRGKVLLLHCTTEYPAPFADANLRAIETMRQSFGLPVGLSDHTPGIAIPIAAAALGASVIEKHFTVDRKLPGPDHKASLEPDELRAMIQGIRAVESALGDGRKRPMPSEIKNRAIARRSLVTSKPIARGETLTADNLGAKRPGEGISPMRYWAWLGQRAKRAYEKDSLVRR
ncbi:MAG: N-acetylneuraminate synthase [Rhodospirillales bacterium]|nr:N-acetylneuraminate synthase [Rhodospirillales bacterium]